MSTPLSPDEIAEGERIVELNARVIRVLVSRGRIVPMLHPDNAEVHYVAAEFVEGALEHGSVRAGRQA